MLTNGQGEWKLSNEGHAVHFKAKHLAYIPKVWHHFITSRLIPMTNVCEVMTKRALLNFSIIHDIPFDVGQVIEDAILYNRDAKMNLGHPFLIYGLCKSAGVPLEDNEAWIHPIKAIVVKKDKPGVPQSEVVYDSGHEPLNEEELTYQTLFGMREESPGEASQPSTTHPPPPPLPTESNFLGPSPTLGGQVQDLTYRFDAFWDETQPGHGCTKGRHAHNPPLQTGLPAVASPTSCLPFATTATVVILGIDKGVPILLLFSFQ